MSEPCTIEAAQFLFVNYVHGLFQNHAPGVRVSSSGAGSSIVSFVITEVDYHGTHWRFRPTSFLGYDLLGDVEVEGQSYEHLPLLNMAGHQYFSSGVLNSAKYVLDCLSTMPRKDSSLFALTIWQELHEKGALLAHGVHHGESTQALANGLVKCLYHRMGGSQRIMELLDNYSIRSSEGYWAGFQDFMCGLGMAYKKELNIL